MLRSSRPRGSGGSTKWGEDNMSITILLNNVACPSTNVPALSARLPAHEGSRVPGKNTERRGRSSQVRTCAREDDGNLLVRTIMNEIRPMATTIITPSRPAKTDGLGATRGYKGRRARSKAPCYHKAQLVEGVNVCAQQLEGGVLALEGVWKARAAWGSAR